jgi:chorismate-pyruvate lyase
MSAIDVLGKLDGFDVNLLGSLQRVLLVTDGTLTEILEAYFAERISLVKVAQQVIPATASHGLLNPIPGETLIERKILLQGTRTHSNYVYAESLVAVDRLAPSFRDALLTSDTPLGRLWLEHKLETFKQMHEVRCRPANSLAHYFESGEEEPLLARTYRVISAGRVVMVISEYFPIAYREAPELPDVGRSALAGAAR